MYCYNCDTRNPSGARFCVGCGQGLNEAPAATAGSGYMGGYGTPALAAASVGAVPAAGGNTIVQHFHFNYGQTAVQVQQPSISLLVRSIWFVLVGLWLGQVWLVLAWLLNLTVIGLPLGLWMLNRLPQVMTLRQEPLQVQVAQQGSSIVVSRAAGPSFPVRAVYFLFIGWWLSLLWLQLAWAFAASLIGLPLAFLMFERTAVVTTLGE